MNVLRTSIAAKTISVFLFFWLSAEPSGKWQVARHLASSANFCHRLRQSDNISVLASCLDGHKSRARLAIKRAAYSTKSYKIALGLPQQPSPYNTCARATFFSVCSEINTHTHIHTLGHKWTQCHLDLWPVSGCFSLCVLLWFCCVCPFVVCLCVWQGHADEVS